MMGIGLLHAIVGLNAHGRPCVWLDLESDPQDETHGMLVYLWGLAVEPESGEQPPPVGARKDGCSPCDGAAFQPAQPHQSPEGEHFGSDANTSASSSYDCSSILSSRGTGAVGHALPSSHERGLDA